jgi:hypothetical protein
MRKLIKIFFHRVKTSLIGVPEVKRGMIQAKNDSNFGSAEKHEEGGLILKDKNGNLSTQAWPAGETDRLIPPSHPDGGVGDKEIVGSYHTHPNIGSDYRQEPSQADINWVVNNPKNAGNKHFVISEKKIYKIDIQGNVTVVGKTKKVLKLKHSSHCQGDFNESTN